MEPVFPALAGKFFTHEPPGKPGPFISLDDSKVDGLWKKLISEKGRRREMLRELQERAEGVEGEGLVVEPRRQLQQEREGPVYHLSINLLAQGTPKCNNPEGPVKMGMCHLKWVIHFWSLQIHSLGSICVLEFKIWELLEFPGRPVFRPLHYLCRGLEFDSWWGSRMMQGVQSKNRNKQTKKRIWRILEACLFHILFKSPTEFEIISNCQIQKYFCNKMYKYLYWAIQVKKRVSYQFKPGDKWS